MTAKAPTLFMVYTIDPTRTLTIRNRFVADFRRRFRMLMSDVKEAVIDLDCFGLSKPTLESVINAAGISPQQFDFPLNAQKIDAFTTWLDGKSKEYLLSSGRTGFQTSITPDFGGDYRNSWMNIHIDSGYQQGIRRGRSELRKAGVDIPSEGNLGSGDPIQVAFNSPMHADRVGLVYSRSYSSLKGITSAMDSTVSDVLAMGLADGRNPRQIAQMLNFTITGQGKDLGIKDSLGRFIPAKRRAEILARTETIRAHHAANMGEYRAAGLLGITIMAEHLTAGDARVCPQCAPLNGKIYSLTQAEYMIPVHPQCRCVAIPYMPEQAPLSDIDKARQAGAALPLPALTEANRRALFHADDQALAFTSNTAKALPQIPEDMEDWLFSRGLNAEEVWRDMEALSGRSSIGVAVPLYDDVVFNSLKKESFYKNQFMLKNPTSGGFLGPGKGDMRDLWEGNILGNTYQKNPKYKKLPDGEKISGALANERPKYGFMMADDPGNHAGSYGSVVFEFGDDLKGVSSMTVTNSSVNLGSLWGEVGTFNQPTPLFVRFKQQVDRFLTDASDFWNNEWVKMTPNQKMTFMLGTGDDYIEAQIHTKDAVDLKRAKKIWVREWATESARKRAKELGELLDIEVAIK